MKFSLLLFAFVCLAFGFANTSKAPTHHVTKHVVDAAAAHGHAKAGDKHEDHKHIKKVGKDSKHHVETAHKGNHGSISHKIIDDEKALKKSTSHSEGGHQSHKKAGAHQEHGAKFQEAAKHKKTGFAKGFHENYHKDEQKKHDSFYSHGKKSGDWKSFSGKNSKHASHKADKVEYKNKMALKSLDQHGKAAKKASGHSTSDHKSHKAEKPKKSSHYEKQQKWAKKHVKPENKQKYKYVQSH